MNALIENTLLKIGVGLQTMGAPKVPAMLKNLFKSQTPLEKLNQERVAMGYDPLTQSEWLATAGGAAVTSVAATDLHNDFKYTDDMFTDDMFTDPLYSNLRGNIYYNDDDWYDDNHWYE